MRAAPTVWWTTRTPVVWPADNPRQRHRLMPGVSMSDTPNPETPESTPAPVESGQPEAAQTDPPETTTPDPRDAQIERLTNQVNGMRSMVDPLIQAGVRTADDVTKALEARSQVQAFRDKGLDLSGILSGAAPEQPEPQAQTSGMTLDDINALLDQREATSQHKAATQESFDTIRGYAKEIGGENADLVWDIAQMVMAEYDKSNGSRYPIDHPLHDKAYMPYTDSDIASIKSLVQGRVDKIRGMGARQTATDQVPQTQTPGGGGGTDGAATDARGTGLMDRDSRKALIERTLGQHVARLSGESISNA